ncbi:GcrA family cell cycle regulator [Brevundimonas viscosa]|uniref:GcrA cell cycle regulator n=1 Tax=Brevundimonas viscosa TaxID=871741 RepID=A0A1I6PR54_9CAUL|nr:GcrA family cell cycle regulator [Brevundimonas viscosa]SFS42600.1 hypothetical protein SAMN05192570_1198 [Brevundimonas viscosa]
MTAHGNNKPWPEKQVEKLKKLWAEGKSGTEIADILGGGLTRAAVIGKANRLGLAQRSAPENFITYLPNARRVGAPEVRSSRQAGAINARKGRPPKPAPHLKPADVFGSGYVPSITPAEAQKRSEASAAAGRKLVSAFAAPANDDAILLINRRAFQCSWPVGDPVRPADQLCCGQPVPEDANRAVPTYCPAHAARAVSRSVLKGAPDPKAYERSLRRFANV